MGNIELKPCPFCGGEAKIDDNYGFPGFRDKKYLAFCSNYDKDSCWGMQENWFDTIEEAVEAWNRRVENEKNH